MSHEGQRGRWLRAGRAALPVIINFLWRRLKHATCGDWFTGVGRLGVGGGSQRHLQRLKSRLRKKHYAQVKALSAETAKEAQDLAKEAQPSDASQVDAWKGRQQFAKEAQEYAEYALAVSASQATDPAITIQLTDALIAQIPRAIRSIRRLRNIWRLWVNRARPRRLRGQTRSWRGGPRTNMRWMRLPGTAVCLILVPPQCGE